MAYPPGAGGYGPGPTTETLQFTVRASGPTLDWLRDVLYGLEESGGDLALNATTDYNVIRVQVDSVDRRNG